MTQATVILVTRNASGTYFPACLRALKEATSPNWQLIVIDNNSADNTVQITKDILKPDELLIMSWNSGVARAFNLGATRSLADNLIFVTHDVLPDPDCITHIIDKLQSKSNIGAVGCKLLYPDRKTIQHAGAKLEYPRAIGVHIGLKEEDKGQYEESTIVRFVTGAIFGVQRSAWQSIMGFDKRFYPLYYEDADFCLRLSYKNLENWYHAQAVAVHIENSVTKTRPGARHWLLHINRLRFAFKHYSSHVLANEFTNCEINAFHQTIDNIERNAMRRAYRWCYERDHGLSTDKLAAVLQTLARIRSAIGLVDGNIG